MRSVLRMRGKIHSARLLSAWVPGTVLPRCVPVRIGGHGAASVRGCVRIIQVVILSAACKHGKSKRVDESKRWSVRVLLAPGVT